MCFTSFMQIIVCLRQFVLRIPAQTTEAINSDETKTLFPCLAGYLRAIPLGIIKPSLGQRNIISWMTNPTEQDLDPNFGHQENNFADIGSFY